MKAIHPISNLTQRAAKALLLFTTIGLLNASTAAIQAATVSDLLEQGVYAEETKGDLAAAVKLYEQVVQEAKTGEAVAAQAQYRLGVCYYKQKKFTEANAAFEKVVKDFPNQKELVRLASDYLASAVALQPAPWTDGEEMRLTIKSATGYELGFVRYTIHSDTLDGRKIWSLGSRLVVGPKIASRVEVDADTFKPIHSRWKHTILGDADATYTTGHAEVKLAGKDKPTSVDLDGVAYDNEEVVQLVRRLPLAKDYRKTLRVFTSLGGAHIIPIEFKVEGVEDVEVPAGKFNCYKIHLGTVNQTFWYSTDEHRYLVKFDAGAIIAELTSVKQITPSELKSDMATAFDFELGEAGGGVPTIKGLDSQPLQNQAKVLILSAHKLGEPLHASDWCDALKAGKTGLPELGKGTVFALNAAVAGDKLTDIPANTVVFFETAKHGWNQCGGAELLAHKSMGVAVAFADGRALLVDPSETSTLRWNP